ncbi:MAG: hypothetical protein HPM95_06165 [Alphaproteobacteria bacterium]|nr:hypothetical protein [Alphaproteobacteria bacterium]
MTAAIADSSQAALLVSGATGAGDEVYVWADEKAGQNCLRDMSRTPRAGRIATMASWSG